MSDPSPSEILTTAAQALRDAANATRYEMKTGTYWQGLAPDVAWERGITNAVGGPAGDFCALMSPDTALALADWLDDAVERLHAAEASAVRVWANPDADDLVERAEWVAGQVNPHALAVAQQLLGGES